MKLYRRRRHARLLVGAIVLAAAAAIASEVRAAERVAIDAVASFSIIGDWVHRVGGERVRVMTLVGPNGDAHVYEPTPLDVRSVAVADIVVINGLGFEGWIGRLVKSSGGKAKLVEASRGVTTIAVPGSRGSAFDPHAWHDVGNAIIYVGNIADGLCSVDTAGCPDYRRAASRYSAELDALDRWIRARIGKVPAARRTVITSHDAFSYFGRAYGITFLAPQGMSTDSAPSAGDVARLIRQIRRDSASALFVENITDTRLIDQIARETGLRPGGVLYSDALSDPQGDAPSYIEMMRHNANVLATAMIGRGP